MNELDQDDAVERMLNQLQGILKPHQKKADSPRRVEASIDASTPDQSRSDEPSSDVGATGRRPMATALFDGGSPEHPGATETLQPGAGHPSRDQGRRVHVKDLLSADADAAASASETVGHEPAVAASASETVGHEPAVAAPATETVGHEPDVAVPATEDFEHEPDVAASAVEGFEQQPDVAAPAMEPRDPDGVATDSAGTAADITSPEVSAGPVREPIPDVAAAAATAEAGNTTRRLSTRLGKLLVDSGQLSDAQLLTALQRQRETGERLGEVLVNAGYVDEPALLSVLERQYGVPAVSLDDAELDSALATLIPSDMASRYLLVPLALHADAVDVAMVDPTDFVAQAHVRFVTGLRPNVFITTVTGAQRAIARLYGGEQAAAIAQPQDPREAVKRMIRDRDSMLIAADQDARKFYELAASIDAFVDEIFRKATGTG